MDIREVAEVEIFVAPFDWPFAREEFARIDAHWAEQRALKSGLFDGKVLLSRGLEVEGRERNRLQGHAFAVDYRAFLSWRDFGFPGLPVHNLFAMPALRSADGAFMLGRMHPGTANAGRLYFPAGTPEPDDADASGRVDFDANILRELEEETGISAGEVDLVAGWTVVLAGPIVGCMKIAQSAQTAEALVARVAGFIGTQAEPELTELVAVHDRSGLDHAQIPPFMLHYLEQVLPAV